MRELTAVCVKALLFKVGRYRSVRLRILIPFNYRTIWPDFPRVINPEKDSSKWFLEAEVNACSLLDWLHSNGASEWDSAEFISLQRYTIRDLERMWKEWDIYTPNDILRRTEGILDELTSDSIPEEINKMYNGN